MPNNTDLKSAYCIESLKSDLIPSLKSLIEVTGNIALTGGTKEIRLKSEELEKELQNRLDKVNQDMHRLQSYLLPRISRLDILGLELAVNRAKEDKKQSLSCLPKCKGNSDLIACFESCENSMGKPSERTRACHSIDFLPY